MLNFWEKTISACIYSLFFCLTENFIFGVISKKNYFLLRRGARSAALQKITEVFVFLFAGIKQLTVHIFWVWLYKQ